MMQLIYAHAAHRDRAIAIRSGCCCTRAGHLPARFGQHGCTSDTFAELSVRSVLCKHIDWEKEEI